MKTKMKNRWLGAMLLMATLIGGSSFVAWNTGEDTPYGISDKEWDAKFLADATQISLAEIELGKLAQQNSKMADVTSMGKMMVDDHQAALKQVNNLAKSKGIAVPAARTMNAEEEYKKLSQKTGKDFDKEYCQMMINGHKDAIHLFEKASKDAEDAEIREWARNTVPTLQKHLEHAETCKSNCDKMK